VDPRLALDRLDHAHRGGHQVFEGSALTHQISVWLIIALGFVLLLAR